LRRRGTVLEALVGAFVQPRTNPEMWFSFPRPCIGDLAAGLINKVLVGYSDGKTINGFYI
jgi:hypothetical protein